MNRPCSLLLLFALLPQLVAAQERDLGAKCRSQDGKDVPVIERPGLSGGGPLVVVLTGDGGWANADQKVAEELLARGSAVVGVSMRAYLSGGRTPDETARDVGCVARRYAALWQRSHIVLLGYSRGADIAPFVATRWPADLRERLSMVMLVSMSINANFTYHLIDLIRDVVRPDDVPIAPEITRLRGLDVICVYGEEDDTSGCTKVDQTIVKAYARRGGHRLTEGFAAIVDLIAPALKPT